MNRRSANHSTPSYSAIYREYLDHKADLAFLRFALAWAHYERILRKYDPNQPRIPAGNPDGGQWTGDGHSRPLDSQIRIFPSREETALFNVRPGTERRGVDIPSNIPHGVDLEANIREARKNRPGPRYSMGGQSDYVANSFATYWWFYQKVKNSGPWDYKKGRGRQYEDFGNFHYGVVGSAAGFSEATLLRMAGWAHTRGGNPGSGTAPSLVEGLLGIGGAAPFGDDENDQYWISKGIRYYRRYYEGLK